MERSGKSWAPKGGERIRWKKLELEVQPLAIGTLHVFGEVGEENQAEISSENFMEQPNSRLPPERQSGGVLA